jgi:hypothetical protein
MNFQCAFVESFSEFIICISKIFPEFVMILDCPQTALRKFELTEPTQYKKNYLRLY